MSNSDFLNKMLEEGEKHSSKPSFRTIGRMTIKLGYSGMVKGHSMKSLFKVYDKPENGEYVSKEVTGRIKELGGLREAILCMLVEVPDDMALNSDWGYSRLVNSDEIEDWEVTIQAIREFDLPILEPFWCAYQLIDSPTALAKGDEGKYPKKKDGVETGEMVYPRIALPIEKFANEQTAREAIESGNSAGSSSTSQWSDLAVKSYNQKGDMSNLESQRDSIINWLDKAKSGIPFNENAENFPLPDPPTTPALKQYICDIWGDITPADIDILQDMSPF